MVHMLTFSGSAQQLGLESVTFSAAIGELIGMTGPTGRQDRLVGILAGAVKPGAGEVLFNGQPLAPGQSFFVPCVSGGVFAACSSEQTIHNFFHWYHRKGGVSQEEQQDLLAVLKIHDLVKDLELPNGRYHVRGVSTGEQELLAVGCGMMSGAPILLLEQPLVAAWQMSEFWEYLKARRTRLVIYSTFEYGHLSSTDRVYWVEDRILACGTYKSLYNQFAPFRSQVQLILRSMGVDPPTTM